MFNRLSTNTLNWIIIVGVILFIVELAFFHGGMIGVAIFSGVFTYVGWKNYAELWGKIIFWIGLIGFIVSILNMIAVRFLIIVFIVLLLMDYVKSQKEKERITPVVYIDKMNNDEDPMIKTIPFFKQMLYGDQYTDNTAYEWHDINIQGGIGDRIIDLSNTVLPEDTSIVSIRHFVGNITIYVPYEVEIMIHHSAIFGRAYILNKYHHQLMNQVISYKTKYYDTTYPRIKIITSLVSGNIEVKRI